MKVKVIPESTQQRRFRLFPVLVDAMSLFGQKSGLGLVLPRHLICYKMSTV